MVVQRKLDLMSRTVRRVPVRIGSDSIRVRGSLEKTLEIREKITQSADRTDDSQDERETLKRSRSIA